MRVYVVHEREIRCTMKQAGEIVATYGTINDRLHPYELWPRTEWEGPDGPPAVGRIGNRGAAQFLMTEYENGQRVRYTWKFIKPEGFDGYHRGEVEEIGDGKLRFRAIIDMETRGLKALLIWLLLMRPLHNAVVEDSFSKMEREVGLTPRVNHWSAWVRFLRWLKRRKSAEYQRIHRQQA